MTYYLTDGTPEGFYTAVFDAYRDPSACLTAEKQVQLTFGGSAISVVSDPQKALRVRTKLLSVDRKSVDDLSLLLRNSASDAPQKAFLYIKRLLACRAPIRDRHADPAVFAAFDLIRKVTEEAHRFTGFLRFTENDSGVLYAPYAPDHDITALLLPHFEARLRGIPFLIHDTKRGLAAIYNGEWHTFARVCERAEFTPSAEQADWERLWKSYYAHVNLAERPHEKQMRGYMPVRYWKYLPEKH